VARELGEVGVTAPDVTARFVLMARYRNRMVHFYDDVTERERLFIEYQHYDATGVWRRSRF
jgi:uncharacterized protein YutE (UPF0331/DUF86 family)